MWAAVAVNVGVPAAVGLAAYSGFIRHVLGPGKVLPGAASHAVRTAALYPAAFGCGWWLAWGWSPRTSGWWGQLALCPALAALGGIAADARAGLRRAHFRRAAG